jgi:TOBE domain
MTNLGRAGLAGAVIVLGAFLWKYRLSVEDVLDPFIWMLLTGIAVFGAILGVAGELAWQHFRESRMWMVWTALCLAALSGLIVMPFIQKTRENTAFFATADSTRGVVESKIYRGGPRLRVVYTIAGQQHRLVTPGGDPRYDQWTGGDSVWVHFQAIAPDSARVGRFGPRAAPMLRSLSWLWGIGGLLLLGYLPPVVALLKREWREAKAKRTTAQLGPDS